MKTLSTFVLDDHPPFRKTLRRVLSHFDFISMAGEAGSAEEALEAVDRLCPNLVIADIRLSGGMDGFEFSKIVKSRFPETHVIITTLHDKLTYRREAVRLGFPYIPKPLLLDELPWVLDTVCGGSGETKDQDES